MEDNAWPLPVFYFRVTIAGQHAHFCEVSGLDVEAQLIEYRQGNSSEWSPIKMPGLKKLGNVRLKRGILARHSALQNWIDQAKMNTILREEVVISLLDDQQNPRMSWTLRNAWPTKIIGMNFNTNGQEVTVEELELTHEGITLTHE